MDSTTECVPPQSPAPGRGLAIASLILGIVGLFFSLAVVGAILGMAGLGLGLAHILRRQRAPTAMAWWGVSLSLLSIVASVGLGFVYFSFFKTARQTFTSIQSASGLETQWEGVRAPDFLVTDLEGNPVHLKELRGKRVVLDFWATWCSPCVKEIPDFIKLRNETSRDELIIVAISKESPETLKPFVKQKGVNYTIVSTTALPPPFNDLQAVPTTFFIDRNGVIQSVAAGSREYADLKQLALAKDFEGEARTEPASGLAPNLKDAQQPIQPTSLWSNNVVAVDALCAGDWDGDGTPDILVAANRKLHILDLNGAEKRVLALPEVYSVIECGRHRQNGARLLGYSQWGRKVEVLDSNGKKLWSYPSTLGINGAHWGDLDGDGTDELIVGMNGFGGLDAVSADGKRLWHASLANVWSQTVVPAAPDRRALIFASEAGGTVRVFDSKGQALRTVRPGGGYFTTLAAAPIASSGKVQVLALGQDNRNSTQNAVAFDSNGQAAWSAPVQAAGGWTKLRFASGDISGKGDFVWAFLDAAGDLVLATASGEKLSTIPAESGIKDFILLSDKNGRALLILLRGSTLQAYSFQ